VAVSYVFLSNYHLSPVTLMTMTLVGGLAGGTAELLPLEVDDNFSIPIVSGFILWLGFILLGI
jgi:dolichol kinase